MLKRIKNHYEIVILVGIIFYIAVLLFYNLGVQSFWIDEGYSSYVSKYMSLEGLYKSKYFLFEWLQALCFKLGGISDFWARFPSVITHIISVLFMYLIPTKLTKNKYVGLFSALIFGLLHWELGRGRDARFYSLVQCIFLLGIYLVILWTKKGKVLYLNIALLLASLGMIFHPFLYCLGAIIGLIFISQYKKLWDFKTLFSKKYLSMWILILLGLIVLVAYGTLGNVMEGKLTNGLSWEAKKYYFLFYSKHLWGELGMISILGIIGMLWFILRKKVKELIVFTLPFLIFVYALVIKGYLMHSRYVLLIFPLMILSTVIFVYDILQLCKNKYEKCIILGIVFLAIGFTAHFQILPKTYYYFDYTSPQPDFKSAYASLPDGKNIISGFPILCDWYYSERGNCSRAIRVDLVHDGTASELLKIKSERYTSIPYVDGLESLDDGIYYFVFDNLTENSIMLNKQLYTQVVTYGKKIYEDGTGYNHIFIVALGVD